MKRFLDLLATVGIATLCFFASSDAAAQVETRTNALSLVNGTDILTLTYTGSGPGTFTFPNSSSTLVPEGSSSGQTLRWDGFNWATASNFINDGTDITMPSGNLTLTSGTVTGNGSGLTDLSATNISSGSLDLARISTTGASANQALMYNGSSIAYGNPAAGSLVLPFSQSGAAATNLFSITNTAGGTTGAAKFSNTSGSNNWVALEASSSTGLAGLFTSSGSQSALQALTFTGVAMFAVSNGIGTAFMAQSLNGRAGRFQINNATNSSTSLEVATLGGGDAFTSSAAGGDGIYSISTSGRAAHLEITSASNSSVALHASTAGIGRAILAEQTNEASSIPAVAVTSAGVGGAMNVTTTNSLSTDPTLSVSSNSTSSTGLAVSTSGGGDALTSSATSGNAIVGTSTSGVGGKFNAPIGVQIEAGALIGSYDDVNTGEAISVNLATVRINDDGAGTIPNATLAAGLMDGQIMIVCTSDTDGATINSTLAVPGDGCITLVYMGAWRQTQ